MKVDRTSMTSIDHAIKRISFVTPGPPSDFYGQFNALPSQGRSWIPEGVTPFFMKGSEAVQLP